MQERSIEDIREKFKSHPVLSKIQFIELSEMAEVINMDYLARRFFDKDGEWLRAKIQSTPDSLTAEERKQLEIAIDVVALELQDISDQLHEHED